MAKTWIREDRGDGSRTELTAEKAEAKLRGYYSDLKAAMAEASEKTPLTTGYAYYFPKEA